MTDLDNIGVRKVLSLENVTRATDWEMMNFHRIFAKNIGFFGVFFGKSADRKLLTSKLRADSDMARALLHVQALAHEHWHMKLVQVC